MPTQAERTANTQAAIIEAAYRAFEAAGSTDVALEHIAEQAGVTKGSIHYHFGNRSGLLAAVALWAFQQIEQRVAQITANATGARHYVRALLAEQATPMGRVLFAIGDALALSGNLQSIDPHQYLCGKLQELGVQGSTTVVAAAVVQLGRQLAYGLAQPNDIDAMVAGLRQGGNLL